MRDKFSGFPSLKTLTSLRMSSPRPSLFRLLLDELPFAVHQSEVNQRRRMKNNFISRLLAGHSSIIDNNAGSLSLRRCRSLSAEPSSATVFLITKTIMLCQKTVQHDSIHVSLNTTQICRRLRWMTFSSGILIGREEESPSSIDICVMEIIFMTLMKFQWRFAHQNHHKADHKLDFLRRRRSSSAVSTHMRSECRGRLRWNPRAWKIGQIKFMTRSRWCRRTDSSCYDDIILGFLLRSFMMDLLEHAVAFKYWRSRIISS